jgi:hypothetical protein
VRVTFPDGQQFCYDRCRPVDWTTRTGEHLLYPLHFGNGLDIGRFDERGLPMVVPPNGLRRREVEIAGRRWAADSEFVYHDVQHEFPHPHICDPLTLPLAGRLHGDHRLMWFEPQVDGDRVCFHYWQPLKIDGYHSWNYVLVWESWWPIERRRHGTGYHGLARLVEVQIPEAFREGYLVMLNNGFGPLGSRKGVVSYSTGFRSPGHEVVDFSGGNDTQVIFQHPKMPREGGGYHPDQDCLQCSPLVFYDWGRGSLTITARSLYYHCSCNSASYAEHGADGVWPNLAWSMALSGKRTMVDCVEYLYAPDTSEPLPQRFINARIETYAEVSRRMSVQDRLAAAAVGASVGGVKDLGGPSRAAAAKIAACKRHGLDGWGIFHDFWHAVAISVDDRYRTDPAHDCNPLAAKMCRTMRSEGVSPGFWLRPEFTTTSITSALSATIPAAEVYYGYRQCSYPELVPVLNREGLPLFRKNPHWVRARRDGAWPSDTPYQWVPMSMAGGWWERIIWPAMHMSRKLGFEWLLMDGGFGGMQGVDYGPMRAGEAAGAVACQPYWWRMFRSMRHIGLLNFGECSLGWRGAMVNLIGPGDEYFLWMFQTSTIWGMSHHLPSPAHLHKLYQLYNGVEGRYLQDQTGTAPVCRFASRFFAAHRPPERIELKDLGKGEAREHTVEITDSLVAGSSTRISGGNKYRFTAEQWEWGDAVWHFSDGTSAVYPAYEKIDWEKE